MIVRSIQIISAATLFLLDLLTALVLRRLGGEQRMRTLPERTRRRIEKLGPTFIKLGQALSGRRDLLEESWTENLSSLQSQAPPFPAAVAVDIVEDSLGADTKTLFAKFERTPLAAGSVAQVHAAQLHDGRDVVVKILRPRVGDDIRRDMRILLVLVSALQLLIPVIKRRRTVELVQEVARNLRRETDLKQEARNIRLFARAFADSPSVFIPNVVDELSTALVITQERSLGTAIESLDPDGQDDALTATFIDFYLRQFFVLGVFHADPHPGNLLVMADGRLCVHDFGAVGRLDAHTREALLGFVAAFIHLDPDWLTDAAIDLGLITQSADRTAIARGVDGILAELGGTAFAEWSLARTMIDIGRLSPSPILSLPPYLASLVRTVFTAESTLRKLNPDTDFLQLLQAAGSRLLAARRAELMDNLRSPRLEWELARLSRRGPVFAADWIHSFSQASRPPPLPGPVIPFVGDGGIDRAARQIALALAALGSYIAGALLMFADRGPQVMEDVPLLALLAMTLALFLTALVLLRPHPNAVERR